MQGAPGSRDPGTTVVMGLFVQVIGAARRSWQVSAKCVLRYVEGLVADSLNCTGRGAKADDGWFFVSHDFFLLSR